MDKGQEKIAKGLKLLIEGSLDMAKENSSEEDKTMDEMVWGCLGQAKQYMSDAKNRNYFPKKDLIALNIRYQSIFNKMQEKADKR